MNDRPFASSWSFAVAEDGHRRVIAAFAPTISDNDLYLLAGIDPAQKKLRKQGEMYPLMPSRASVFVDGKTFEVI